MNLPGPIAPPPGSGPGPQSVRRAMGTESRRTRGKLPVPAAGLGIMAVIAVTAAITYGLVRNCNPEPSAPHAAAPASQQPKVSNSDPAGAKEELCRYFDIAVRGRSGQGGVRIASGDLNVPVVLRDLNSAVAVQNALSAAIPPEVAAAARKYIHTVLDLTTAATGTASVDEMNRLTIANNNATDAFDDACGLPH